MEDIEGSNLDIIFSKGTDQIVTLDKVMGFNTFVRFFNIKN